MYMCPVLKFDVQVYMCPVLKFASCIRAVEEERIVLESPAVSGKEFITTLGF
jgi:hypothetical protein